MALPHKEMPDHITSIWHFFISFFKPLFLIGIWNNWKIDVGSVDAVYEYLIFNILAVWQPNHPVIWIRVWSLSISSFIK